MSQDRTSRYILIVIGSIVAFAIVALLVYSNRPPEVDDEVFKELASVPRGVTEEGRPFLGAEDAPLTMVVYEDLGCPNCKNFYQDVEPHLLEEYIKTGQVRLEVYTLAFVNQQSLPGAEGAACALEQGKFWEFRDLVFANQSVRQFNRTALVEIADQAGLDVDEFSNCFDQRRHQASIIQKSQAAFELGITGTPTTDLNGTRIVGVRPWDSNDPELLGFMQLVEQALQEVGQ